ncbi:MAG: hypothetical protein J0I32_21450 [Sphingobacteriales bacterium]|nr:hypothetical protein [Sphingobacteriales bacterium]OJW02220.1 MAG: hypothetical protein BGO52_22805 [Sphingobacteriales bacterium 44-61]
MKARRFILRCATFALLLVFSQKVGVDLFLHNLFHGQDLSRPLLPSQKEGAKEISFACNCIDDFLMPFTETEEIVLPTPVTEYQTPTSFFRASISFRPVISSALRGPPSLVL